MEIADILGEKSVIRVLEYMITVQKPMYLKEIAENSGVSLSTVHYAIGKLLEFGLVKTVGERGYPRYQVKLEHPFLKGLQDLMETLKREELTGYEGIVNRTKKLDGKKMGYVAVGPFVTELYGYGRYDPAVYIFGEKKDEGVDYTREYRHFTKTRMFVINDQEVKIPEKEDAILSYTYLIKKRLLPIEDLISMILKDGSVDWIYVVTKAREWRIQKYLARIVNGLRKYDEKLPNLEFIIGDRIKFTPEFIRDIKEKLGE